MAAGPVLGIRGQSCDRVDVVYVRLEPQPLESACDIVLAGSFVPERRKVLRRDADQRAQRPHQFRAEVIQNAIESALDVRWERIPRCARRYGSRDYLHPVLTPVPA
jgi:hypothetical protein